MPSTLKALPFLLAACTFGLPLTAADTPKGPVARALSALALYHQGSQTADPLTLLEAAQIAQGLQQRALSWNEIAVTTRTLPAAPEGEATPQHAPTRQGPALADLASRAYRAARLLAEEDEELADLVEALRPPAINGAVAILTGELAAGSAKSWQFALPSAVVTEIAVLSPASLAWQVESASGEVLCAAHRPPEEICAITPSESGFYQLKLENPDQSPQPFDILSH